MFSEIHAKMLEEKFLAFGYENTWKATFMIDQLFKIQKPHPRDTQGKTFSSAVVGREAWTEIVILFDWTRFLCFT